MGQKGDSGNAGPPGFQGEQGIQGPPGAPGLMGPMGPPVSRWFLFLAHIVKRAMSAIVHILSLVIIIPLIFHIFIFYETNEQFESIP